MIIFIDGVNGIGKSTIAQEVNDKIIDGAIILESDESFQKMIKKNINVAFIGFRPQNNRYFLQKFYDEIIQASKRNEYVIIPMTLGEKECKEELLDKLDYNKYELIHIILYANSETLKKRILDDKKQRNTRESLNNFEMHNLFLQNNYKDAVWIDTTEKTIEEIANNIIKLINIY